MKRIASIDIFRALTMLMMVFVNDFAGMSGLPHWLHHARTTEDMLGFSDLVFPAFLFCVGLSIPFAIGARYQKGDNALQVLGHVCSRTLALLVMGIFSMNLRGVDGGLSRPVLTLLAIAGYFLVWNSYPREKSGRYPAWVRILQMLGAALLIGLVVYKDVHEMPFRHGWWGILGLIGWAYLPCALAFVALKGDFQKLKGFWLLTLLLCVLNAVPAIPKEWSSRAVLLGFWPGGWTHPLLCATGMMMAMLLVRIGDQPKKWFTYCLALVGALCVFGLLSHRVWIISKNLATPTWAFFCLAIFVLLFGLLHWATDVKGHTRWARIIAPAGTATLTCYMMPSIWASVQQLLGWSWPAVLTNGIPGLVKALGFAFLMVGFTWLFTRIHLKLKV
jgi:predicted acyltransferase